LGGDDKTPPFFTTRREVNRRDLRNSKPKRRIENWERVLNQTGVRKGWDCQGRVGVESSTS